MCTSQPFKIKRHVIILCEEDNKPMNHELCKTEIKDAAELWDPPKLGKCHNFIYKKKKKGLTTRRQKVVFYHTMGWLPADKKLYFITKRADYPQTKVVFYHTMGWLPADKKLNSITTMGRLPADKKLHSITKRADHPQTKSCILSHNGLTTRRQKVEFYHNNGPTTRRQKVAFYHKTGRPPADKKLYSITKWADYR